MGLSVNMPKQGSEEWIESCGNETLHPFIEEIEDEDEWMNSSVNPPSELEDFNEITIQYISTDNSLMDIWNSACPDDTLSETWINATLSLLKSLRSNKMKERRNE